MNFLAHAVLADHEPALIVGGVIGDWIKGPLPAGLPPDLARGVALHRAIDSHAESHPAFQRSRHRISPARRRYAGVFIDIFYDHILARDWSGPLRLDECCAGIYRHIAARTADLPAHVGPVMALMAREDWLASYAEIDGMRDVLHRMSRRARQPNPLAGGMDEFTADPQPFSEDFADWYGDAQAFVSEWCQTRPLLRG